MILPGHFFDLLNHLGHWQVLLDILIFALAIFYLSRTLRATGTWKIAVGLIVAGVLAMLATMSGLRGVEWIFSNLSQFALIVLIVLFQPELRKILERTTTLFGNQSQADLQGLPDLIEKVLFELAGRKWGAIIVLPGNDPIRQWITEGVRVDAVPSFPMLLSIFDPTSPGHDGAMIVEENRISRIGVHLPLSESKKLSDAFGTRHHASLGLAEKTDALVLTVSEERGEISLFCHGEMVPIKEKGEVVAQILAYSKNSGPNMPSVRFGYGKRFWSLFLEIGASLMVATLFWTLVIMGKTENREMIFTVPIQYVGLQENLVLGREIPTEVKLYLEGSSSLLSTMDLSQLRVQVNLTEVTEGDQVVALTAQNVVVPRRVTVTDINPSSLKISVKALHETTLPIKPQLLGKLQEGMKISSVSVNPPSVQVLMPTERASMQMPSSLLTTPIYLHGIKEDATVYCKVIVPAGVQSLERRWPDVEVQIHVIPQKK
ncbi:MAG: diadenylate cyclase [Proteobacteria bacterium]|nr:diadenylate cyclase [Pseudomonadota bacterium]MBU1060670.1 diadenylate cyclase [Pseudomonadota bacterium]